MPQLLPGLLRPPSWCRSVARLLATREVLYYYRIGHRAGSHLFGIGDELPTTDSDLVQAWVEAGSAVWQDDDYTPPTHVKAKLMTAEPGLPGKAVGGDSSGDDLVGKVLRSHTKRKR